MEDMPPRSVSDYDFNASWISVKKKLPNPNEPILACYSGSCYIITELESYSKTERPKKSLSGVPDFLRSEADTEESFSWKGHPRYEMFNGEVVDLSGICLPTPPPITHWMPLPYPPREV